MEITEKKKEAFTLFAFRVKTLGLAFPKLGEEKKREKARNNGFLSFFVIFSSKIN